VAGYLLLCPGQGGQHPAMLEFALATVAGRAAVEEASSAVAIDIARRVAAGDDLFEPVFAQVSMVATALATWRSLADAIPAPAAIAGYSVGEVSAWGCAGAWTTSETLLRVRQRAELMKAASPPDCSMMAVTGVGAEALERSPRSDVHLAIEVDSDHWIMAGKRSAVEAAGAAMASAGAGFAAPATRRNPAPSMICRSISRSAHA